jgi:hypothetical protein
MKNLKPVLLTRRNSQNKLLRVESARNTFLGNGTVSSNDEFKFTASVKLESVQNEALKKSQGSTSSAFYDYRMQKMKVDFLECFHTESESSR